MAISARGKITFFVTILGSIVSLVMSIGFIYLTLPTIGGLILAAFAGVAAAYLGSLILYNIFILQNKEKPNSDASELGQREMARPEITQSLLPAPSEIKKNKAKAYLFAFITTACVLMVAGVNALTTYQSGILLGESLSYPALIISVASVTFAVILGLGVLLAGYDQTHKFFSLIKGENREDQAQPNEHQYQSVPQNAAVRDELGSVVRLLPESKILTSVPASVPVTSTTTEEKKDSEQHSQSLSEDKSRCDEKSKAATTCSNSGKFFRSKEEIAREFCQKNKVSIGENKLQEERKRRYSSPAVLGQSRD